MQAANKIAFNTLILYFRMFITMGISLYATRIVLNSLGSIDFGVYNLIVGVISMLSFLNIALSTSTQRFLSFHHGTMNKDLLNKVFNNSFILHVCIGIVIVIGLEIAGLFLFNGFLNIPENRIYVAKAIYQFLIVSIFFSICSAPFIGALNANENMAWVAIVNVSESLFKLLIAIVLLYLNHDKLLIYGLCTAGISIVSFFLYSIFCLKKYEECSLKKVNKLDRSIVKELSSFAGWNLFGTLCNLGKMEGLAILLNVFFGAVINAAFGIANQVVNQLNFLSATLLQAINPQIMKSEGANDRERMLRFSMMASKFCFFLLAMIAIPCIFEMKTILKMWLKKVPDYTVTFCCLLLISTLINQFTIGLQSAIQASGRIKYYQIFVGSLILLNIPISFLFLKNGFPANSVLICSASIEIVACAIRIYFLKRIVGLSIIEYCSRVLVKEIIPITTLVTVSFLLSHYLHFQYKFLLTCSISILFFGISVYLFGLCRDEKDWINTTIKKKLKRNNASNTMDQEQIESVLGL